MEADQAEKRVRDLKVTAIWQSKFKGRLIEKKRKHTHHQKG